MILTQHGRGKDSGIETETRYAITYEVAGGKITAITLHTSPDAAGG